MRSLIAAVVFVGFAGALTADDKKTDDKKTDDKKYESKEGKFSAVFPDKPMTQNTKAGGVDLNITIVEKAGAGYAVIYSDLPADQVKAAKAKDLLDGGEKGLVTNFKAKVTKTKDSEFGKQKYPAREIYGEKDSIQLRITIILADNRLYQVFVVGTKDAITAKETDEFFKSFEITK